MQVGSYVSRISHNNDIIFRISFLTTTYAILEGVFVRLVADSDISDLKLILKEDIVKEELRQKEYEKQIIEDYKTKINHITGKILHIDSDSSYLKNCLNLYNSLNIYSYGVRINEEDIYKNILDYVYKIRPSIIVITGHDSYNNKGIRDLDNYLHTKDFMKAVFEVRKHFSLDDICIFAGACKSNFEALIASGANFASSCDKKNIEAYDPAIVGILASITPFTEIIDINNVYNYSKMAKGSIGGIETYGKLRLLKRT